MKMGKPGEVVVVPVADADEETTLDAQPEQSPAPEPQPFWVKLWELVFGQTQRPALPHE
jgi:hypothetical protein